MSIAEANLYMFRSSTSQGLCSFSRNPQGKDLPEKFAPWTAFGVVRSDQRPPHGLSREAIETGIDANGYQLWRDKRKI
jgi:hypothetical protein